MSNFPCQEKLLSTITLTNEVVWKNRVNQSNVDEWLSNFQGEVFCLEYEKSLALWLLSNFVFYNDYEVNHLCKAVYAKYLHKRLISSLHRSIDEGLNKIHSRTIFTALGEQGESGSMILYLFRTANNIGIRDTRPHSRVDYDSIVFIDDVTLSIKNNSQAWRYLSCQKQTFKNKNIHIITLIASVEAIEFLESKNISVTNAITLNENSKTFEKESYVFQLVDEKHRINAKKFAKHYGKKCCPSDPLGYSDSQYLFGFYFNVPDNTLPIIWSNQNGWKPIFPRAHKNYHFTKSDELGYFV